MDMWELTDHDNGWIPDGTGTNLSEESERIYYLQDELGSIIKVIGENGKTSAHYNYDEFGRPLPERKFDQNWPGPDNTFGYTGYQYDVSSGLYYAQARYYMPEIGRFISEDPWPGDVAIPQTLNPYPYVLNNPLKYVDPLGLKPPHERGITINKHSRGPIANTTNSVIKKNTSNDTKYSQCPKGIADLEENIIYVGNIDSSYIPPNIGRRIASIGLGSWPIIGDIKDIQEVLTGYDIVAGEKLTWVDRGVTLVCVFLPIISGKLGREVLDEGVKLGKAALKNADEVIQRTRNTQNILQRFADEVNQAISGKGSVVGTKKHSLFKQKVDALGNPNLATEKTFLNGKEVRYGTKGGVRVDVIEYNPNGTVTVYDLKTGNATLTQSRITQIQNAVNPTNPSSVTVIQIK